MDDSVPQQPKDSAAWLKALAEYNRRYGTKRPEGGFTPAEVSQGGVFYNEALKQDGPAGEFGGFFTPITEENYQSETAKLLPDDGKWFIDYLGNGNKGSLSPEQNAFVEAYDRHMTSFLDFRFRGINEIADGENVATDFSFALKDQTLTDSEMAEIIEQSDYKAEIKKMGSLGLPWIKLVGGIMQGAMDYETATPPPFGRVYTAEELKPFYSPESKEKLPILNRDHIEAGEYGTFEEALPAYARSMEEVCGTDPARQFRPNKQRSL